MLAKSDDELRNIIAALETERYRINGWRNHDNRWRRLLGLDSTHNKRVIDYGCGCGVEALQFAKNGCDVYVADIVPANVNLAKRVLQIHGYRSQPVHLSCEPPFFDAIPQMDVFYCAGVLHHTPRAREILQRACESLSPDGEIRLMLYTDNGWKLTTELPVPPVNEDVETNIGFQRFTSVFDCIGCYADWYNAEKIRYRFGDFLDLMSFEYICSDNVYSVATLRKP